MSLLARIGITHPIIQAPMAGVSTPALAAAVSNSGGLGAIAIGAANIGAAREMIAQTQALTTGPFNVNVFTHQPAVPNTARETAWLQAMQPLFAAYGAEPPTSLHEIYTSFVQDEGVQALLVELAPKVVSFHFGLPGQDVITRLKGAGCVLFASVTNREEAKLAVDAGIDALVAQGFAAGGHRGVFNPHAPDEQLSTAALVRELVATYSHTPVIAAGGIMDGQGIRQMLALGAVAAQLGTAFVACPESAADAGYRQALSEATIDATVLTRAVSGRPARCLRNKFTIWGEGQARDAIPDYPIAYDAGKALHAAAKAHGEYGFGAQWAGANAHQIRVMPAARLMQTLVLEMQAAVPDNAL